jgi:hypothetical protein
MLVYGIFFPYNYERRMAVIAVNLPLKMMFGYVSFSLNPASQLLGRLVPLAVIRGSCFI